MGESSGSTNVHFEDFVQLNNCRSAVSKSVFKMFFSVLKTTNPAQTYYHFWRIDVGILKAVFLFLILYDFILMYTNTLKDLSGMYGN